MNSLWAHLPTGGLTSTRCPTLTGSTNSSISCFFSPSSYSSTTTIISTTAAHPFHHCPHLFSHRHWADWTPAKQQASSVLNQGYRGHHTMQCVFPSNSNALFLNFTGLGCSYSLMLPTVCSLSQSFFQVLRTHLHSFRARQYSR